MSHHSWLALSQRGAVKQIQGFVSFVCKVHNASQNGYYRGAVKQLCVFSFPISGRLTFQAVTEPASESFPLDKHLIFLQFSSRIAILESVQCLTFALCTRVIYHLTLLENLVFIEFAKIFKYITFNYSIISREWCKEVHHVVLV